MNTSTFLSVICQFVLCFSFFPLICIGQTADVRAQDAAAEGKAKPATQSVEKQAIETDDARIARLSKYLTNTRWTGQFTVTGKDAPPNPEHYEITQATKSDVGDFWNLVVRIKYGEHDTTLPLPPIEIKWAGETPVITVDRVTIPGMGTFDARVLIRGGQYAGTWSHDKVGGHLFGKIEKFETEK